MTNITAAIIVTISTNWIPVAEWKPLPDGTNTPTKIVENGFRMTNTTAILEWNGTRHEMLLESKQGPKCDERMTDKPWTTIFLNPPIIFTNINWRGIFTNFAAKGL